MNSLLHLAAELQEFLTEHGWRFCFIGGVALQRWGEPRLTRDVDISLLTGFGDEKTYIDPLLARYEPRFHETRAFATDNRVLLLISPDRIPIDISLAAFPMEQRIIDRATEHEYVPGIVLKTCSAEDLIVMKAIADRSRDWGDIEGVMLRQGRSLDWSQILEDLAPLCELNESPEILDKINRLRER